MRNFYFSLTSGLVCGFFDAKILIKLKYPFCQGEYLNKKGFAVWNKQPLQFSLDQNLGNLQRINLSHFTKWQTKESQSIPTLGEMEWKSHAFNIRPAGM